MNNGNNNGWIKLYRQIEENEMYFSERFTKMQAWIDLLLLATHRPKTIFLRGIEINLKAGELACSMQSLAERWQRHERTVKKYLNLMESKQMIQLKTSKLTDRKSTRLNSSHQKISYAVFCLKKKKQTQRHRRYCTQTQPAN